MKLAFYKATNENLFGKAIAWWTKGPYSHVELVFSNGMSFSSSSRDGGTRWKRIDYSDGKWDLVEIPVNAVDEARIARWCDSVCGAKYDWDGIFGFVIPFWRQHANDWFCSEVCTAALQRVGLLSGVNPASTSPSKLYWLSNPNGDDESL